MNRAAALLSVQPPAVTAQRGITLFTAIIFLLMLSLLGVNAAQMSGLEERMAGNIRNRDLAFQAAEATLRYAENNLPTMTAAGTWIGVPTNTITGTWTAAGLREVNVCLPNSADYWNGTGAAYSTDTACPNYNSANPGAPTADCSAAGCKFDWANNSIAVPVAAVSIVGVNAQPRYVVERFPNTGSGGTTQQYRVTAYAVGGDANAVVILQAFYQI